MKLLLFSMFAALPQQLFAKQFQPDKDGYLFRANQMEAPIHVTNAERDAFVSDFRRFNYRLMWGSIAGLFVVTFGMVIVYDDVPQTGLVILTVLFCVIIGGTSFWLHTMPKRALKGRRPVGDALSITEMKAIAASQLSWPLIAFLLVIGLSQTSALVTATERTGMWWFSLCGPFILFGLPIIVWRKLKAK